jgi:hypothetical protein
MPVVGGRHILGADLDRSLLPSYLSLESLFIQN